MKKLLEKIDASGGMPLFSPQVTLNGDKAVSVEGFKTILEYTDNVISLDCGKMILEIVGDALCIKSFSKGYFRAVGKIFSVNFRI